MTERIQKMLATAGVASRREIERLIEEGRILVNGRPAELGQQIHHDDSVRVDGKTVVLQRKMEAARVLIYKKRVGELVTRDDPEGRRTVFRKLPELKTGRWIAVGRLDINTSGLLLFTNHGELARRLTHPSFEVPRQYAARVLGTVDAEVIARWKAGVELDDGVARFERVEASEGEDGDGANQWFLVTVREGRNRLVRRLIESQDLQVSRLIRLRYGPIELGRGMKSSTAREATPQELAALLAAVKLSDAEAGLDKPAKRCGPQRERRRDRDDDDDDGISTAPRHHQRGAGAPPRHRDAPPLRGKSAPRAEAPPRRAASERPARSPAARAQADAAPARFAKSDARPARSANAKPEARDRNQRRDAEFSSSRATDRGRPARQDDRARPASPSRGRNAGPRAQAAKPARKAAPRSQRREPPSAKHVAKPGTQAPRLSSANRSAPQREQRPSSTRRPDSKPRSRK